ncbi:MAG: hypothetical protein ABWZ74_10585 [Hyphomicrobiaceae bacterium]
MSATAVQVTPDDDDQGAGAIGLPIVMMMALAVLLFLPDQVKEFYRIYAEGWSAHGWRNPHLIIAAAAMVVLTLFIWRLARELTRLPGAQRMIPDRWSRLVSDWTPRLVCLLPWAGVAAGMWMSLPPSTDSPPMEFREFYPSLQRLEELLRLGLKACGAIALGLFVIITITELIFARWGKGPFGRPFLVRLWPVYAAIIVGVSIAGFVLDGSRFVTIGVLPILLTWFLAVTGLLSYLWLHTERTRSFTLAALIIGLVTFDYFGWTDNHRFRHSPIDFTWPKQERPNVEVAFDKWLGSRNDMATYREGGRPYPVYVVAAEGGGLYAAYHVAKFLARMQDLCPNFSQHLFAISAVSGGSLGAAMFSSLARDDAKNQEHIPCRTLQRDGGFERRVDRLLRHDFLSHVATATLFQDFVQRFIPIPLYPLDRARKLEASFEDAWAANLPGRPNRMAESFVGSCGPNGQDCLEGATPALVLNLTQIETGMQLALSPFNLDETGPPKTKSGKIYDALAVADIDMPLSTAVGLSARFPWITPSGWYQLPKTKPDDPVRTYRFADGGYAEGSGAGTGYKISQILAERIKANNVNATVHFIMLTATSPPIERNYIDPPHESGYGEFALPFVALSSARRGQAFARVYDIAIGSTDQLRISQGQIYDALIPLAIGWHLSNATHAYVDLYTGDPRNCRDIKADITNHWTMAPTYVVQHDCLTKSIVEELSPPR